MTKKKISSFHKECKEILSSISGRTCRYMYLNIPGFEDYLILTNGDLDIISSYRPYTLAVHMVKPSSEFIEFLFKLIDNPKNDIYLYRTDFILKGLQEADEFNIKYNHLSDGTMTVTNLLTNELVIVKPVTEEEHAVKDESLEDDTDTSTDEYTFDNVSEENSGKVTIDKRLAKVKSNSFTIDQLRLKEIAGSIIKHPYIKDQLLDIVENLYKDFSDIRSNTISHITFDYDPITPINIVHNTWYESNRFKAVDFTPSISNNLIDDNHEQVLVLIKGLDAPSTNEYIAKKISSTKSKQSNNNTTDICSLQQHIYTRNGLNVKHISHFYSENDIEIISSRPYSDIILYKKTISHTKGDS